MRKVGFCLLIAMLAISLSVSAFAKEKVRSPLQYLAVSTYAIGGTSHASCAANLEGIFKAKEIRMRVIPAGTDGAKFWPLRTGDAGFTYICATTAQAAELGIGELFLRPEWGPQKMRAVWFCHSDRGGYVTLPDSDIEKPADIKGHSYGIARGSTGSHMQLDALLSYANLTRDDIKLVYFGSLHDGYLSVARGQADVTMEDWLRPEVQEMYRSTGFKVIPMPNITKEDKECWARVHEAYPVYYPVTSDGSWGAPGATPEKPYYGRGFANTFWTLDTQDKDLVYEFCKVLTETYDERVEVYKLIEGSTLENQLTKDRAGLVPWHPGAIKFFKDKGVWTSEWDKIQAKKLAAEEKRIKEWKAKH